jgi:hypothetical protein
VMKNSKSVVEARLFIGILALSRVRLGLVLDSISNLILTWGLLRFERRFGLGVHWGNFPCGYGAGSWILPQLLCSRAGT